MTIAATADGVVGYALLTVSVPGATPVNLLASMNSGTTENLRAVWGTSSTDVFAVGAGGTILRYDGTVWSTMASETGTVFEGVWGTSSSDIYAVGNAYPGELFRHYDGTTWSEVQSIVGVPLGGVWGASPTEVYVVSGQGAIFHYDGTNWTSMASGTSSHLEDVWGTSTTDVYTVGGTYDPPEGIVLHYDGTAWSGMVLGSDNAGLWGMSPTDVYLISRSDTTFHYNGVAWNALVDVGGGSSIWGTSATDFYAVRGSDVTHYDGTDWTMMGGVGTGLSDLWGTWGGDVYVVGDGGTILRGVRGATVTVTPNTLALTAIGDTSRFVAEATDATSNPISGANFTWSSDNPSVATVDWDGLVSAISFGSANISATATGGLAATATVNVIQQPASVTVTPIGASISGVGTTQQFTAEVQDELGDPIPSATSSWQSLNPFIATVDSSTGVVTAVASGQVTIAATADGITGYALLTVAAEAAAPINMWALSTSGTTNGLHAVSVIGPADVWAVGGGGTALHFDGTSWNAVPTPTTNTLYEVFAISADNIYASGTYATLIHYDGAVWDTLPRFGTSSYIFAMWGSSPEDFFAVWDTGIYHYDGSDWTRQATLPTTTYGIWGTSSDDVWVVGANGMIYRYDGNSWNAVTSPTDLRLREIWGTAPNDVFIVGDDEAAFHWDGSTWTPVDPGGLGLYDYEGVWGNTSTDMYIASEWISEGHVHHFDGATWETVVDDPVRTLLGVGGISTGSVWAVGESGTIYRGFRATIVVTPDPVTFSSVGQTQQLVAEAQDEFGNTIAGQMYTWSSDDELVATVNASGLVTATGPGSATISAEAAGGASGAATVNVVQQPASITVSPGGVSVSGEGSTHQFTAEVRDSSGSVIPSPTVIWTSLNPTVATINPTSGLATAAAAGQVTIEASAGGVIGYALLTVSDPAVSPVTVWNIVDSGTVYDDYFSGGWAYSPSEVFVLGTGVRHFDGSTWTDHPSPQTNLLHDLWGTSPGDLYLVGYEFAGDRGTIHHYDGSTWTFMESVTGQTLNGVWGSSPTDVFAAGGNGTILYYDGTSWTPMTSGTTNDLAAVWGLSPTDVYAAGGADMTEGIVLHYDGTAWSEVWSGTVPSLVDVWGSSGTDIYVAGAWDQVLHYNGVDWNLLRPDPDFGGATFGVWGGASNDVYVLDSHLDSASFFYYDGASWHTTQPAISVELFDIWGAPSGDVFAVGRLETVVRGYRGATVIVSPTLTTLTAIDDTVQLAAQALDRFSGPIVDVAFTWSVDNEAVVSVDQTGLVTATGTGSARVVAEAPGGAADTVTVNVIPVADSAEVTPAGASISGVGTTQQFTVQAWDANGNPIASPSVNWTSLNPNVATINGSTGEATAVASGQATVQAEVDGLVVYALLTVSVPGVAPVNMWVLESTGVADGLNEIWGTSASDVFAVGLNGRIVHHDGTGWSSMSSPTSSGLFGLWGTSPTDVVAVDGGGTVYHYDGSLPWTLMPGTPSITLDALWAASPVARYVVGADGTIAFHDGTSWTTQTSGTNESLFAVWGTSTNDIFVAGNNGTILHSADGSNWSPMTSNTPEHLNDLWGTAPNDVYASGTNGTVVHYNGTTWTPLSSAGSATLFSLWGTTGADPYAPESGGVIEYYNGTTWTATTLAPSNNAVSIWGEPGGEMLASGSNGSVYRGYRGATVNVTPSAPTLFTGSQTPFTALAEDAGGNPIGGVTYTWSSSDSSVAVPDADGLVTAVAVGTGDIIAHAPGGAADTVAVTVVQPGITLPTGTSSETASGLQREQTGSLDFANHGGISVTITSSNPSVLLLSPDGTTSGATSIVVPVANGSASFSYYAQGVEGATGSIAVVASASGFTDGVTTSEVVVAALEISGLSSSTTTTSADEPFVIRVGIPNSGNTALEALLNVRAGAPGPYTATVLSGSPAVGQLVTTPLTGGAVTVEIGVGQSASPAMVVAGGVAFDPLTAGTTTVSASIPGMISTSDASLDVTVTTP